MKHITSTHNERYKHLRQLATNAKYRRRTGQTLLEGIHLCQSYLQHSLQPWRYVYTDVAAENAEVAQIISACEALGVPGILLGEGNFQAISSVEHGIGLMFVVTVPSPDASTQLHNSALLLEDVQDPGNMGTMLRTAAAAGITEVFASSGNASVWSPKVLRAGMGAHFALRIYENQQLSHLIAEAKVQVLATSLSAAETIYQKDLTGPTAWLFGNEGSGVSDELLALNVQQVIIPQHSGVESLNVAASVAVCLFEQVRQRLG